MPEDKHLQLEFEPVVPIPEFLTGEIQSKLAYADERIVKAQVSQNQISLTIRTDVLHPPDVIARNEAIPDVNAKNEAIPDVNAKNEAIPDVIARNEAIPGAKPDIEDDLVEKVQRIVLSMAKGAIRPKVQILEDHMDRPTPYLQDPMAALLETGEVSQELGGIYTLGPLLTRLIDYFEAQFIALADSFDADPYRFPTLIPAKYLERVNYFRAFPHSLTFATHLREDLDIIDNFSQHAACDQHGLQAPPDSFAGVQCLLSPAVCYHLYFALADKPLPNGQVIATAVGQCFRYEAINLTSLERLWDFTMREVIFVGSKDFVLENREIARQRMSRFFERIGMAYRVESANDPFFIGEFRKQAAFQSAFQLKFEIRARLPFKDSTLAVGSYNYHQDFFGRNLNITLPDGSPAHTGCVAFGLERIAFAFLAQFGLDPAQWPAEVRDSDCFPSLRSGQAVPRNDIEMKNG